MKKRLKNNEMKNLLKDYWEYVDNAQQEDTEGNYDLDQITTQFIKQNTAKLKLLGLHFVIGLLPVGTEVTIKNDKEEWGEKAGTKRIITKHVKWKTDEMGYELDGEGIYLNEDFEGQ